MQAGRESAFLGFSAWDEVTRRNAWDEVTRRNACLGRCRHSTQLLTESVKGIVRIYEVLGVLTVNGEIDTQFHPSFTNLLEMHVGVILVAEIELLSMGRSRGVASGGCRGCNSPPSQYFMNLPVKLQFVYKIPSLSVKSSISK